MDDWTRLIIEHIAVGDYEGAIGLIQSSGHDNQIARLEAALKDGGWLERYDLSEVNAAIIETRVRLTTVTPSSDEEREWQERARRAQAVGAQALARLITLAEKSNSSQGSTVARFLASTFDSQTFPYDPFDLRAVDVQISDDMLSCLDCLRWGKLELYKLVPDGHRRIVAVCQAWGLNWPDDGCESTSSGATT